MSVSWKHSLTSHFGFNAAPGWLKGSVSRDFLPHFFMIRTHASGPLINMYAKISNSVSISPRYSILKFENSTSVVVMTPRSLTRRNRNRILKYFNLCIKGPILVKLRSKISWDTPFKFNSKLPHAKTGLTVGGPPPHHRKISQIETISANYNLHTPNYDIFRM